MNDESDMKDALGCLTAVPTTDGVFRLCVRVHDEVTPVAKGFISKPHPSSSNTRTTTSEDRESSINNASFHFDTRDDGRETTTITSRKRRLDFASRQPAQLPEKKILTPVERFIAKTEKNIEEKDKMIQELRMEELNIKGRISAAKRGNVGNGTLCRNCHMRLGHNARNCTFDKCGSVYECGEEKLHSGEVNVKHIAQTLKKLSNEKDKLTAELESRKSAAENVHDSIINRLENLLLEADPSSYHVRGVKNWSLLRKHVFVLRNYCEATLHGRIPPKHDILKCLNTALTSNRCADTPIKQAKRRRENPAKSTLERCGIQFPTQPATLEDSDEERYLETYDRVGSWSPDRPDTVLNDHSRSWIHRIKPTSKNEENEQLKLALSASYAETCHNSSNVPGSHGQSLSSSTSTACGSTQTATADPSWTQTVHNLTQTAPISTRINSNVNVNDAATTLLSLRNCMNTDHTASS